MYIKFVMESYILVFSLQFINIHELGSFFIATKYLFVFFRNYTMLADLSVSGYQF